MTVDANDPNVDVGRWRCSLRVLGAVELRSNDVAVDVGPPRQRALLAILVLHANEVVSTDVLIGELWGERPPRTAAHSVQIYVSELRKMLAQLAQAPVIVTCRPGYRLEVCPEWIDAVQFADLVQRGLQAARSGHVEAGRTDLRDALRLWRGPPLAEFSYEDFAQYHIARLEDVRLSAVEELAAVELDAGNLPEAMRWADSVVDADPLRERGRELMMVARYRSGRHVEAIRGYHRYRRQLADELGIVPSPTLQRLHERMLLHDPALLPECAPVTSIRVPARNPYKGLRSFGEHDAGDFFGRAELVEQMLVRLRDGTRLIALVGPSGSGKSSVVAAGLIPALRAGAVEGSEQWVVASMVPGTRPLHEAEAVIARAASSPATDFRPEDDATQHLAVRPRIRVAPGHGHVLLVVDQFEELFGVADESARTSFLEALTEAFTNGDGPLIAVLTLRADHYDRPLHYGDFAVEFIAAVINVLPMRTDELESAVGGPAAGVGVRVQPALLAQLVADTIDQPGSLPLLQYALTAQFDATSGSVLSLADYEELGGLHAILTRHAESLFESLAEDEQRVAVQALLRMVRTGRGTGDARRRVLMSELVDVELDPVGLSVVLDKFGGHRLLSFDRDPLSGAPTVELAHEALLTEWPRLRGWIQRHRSALVRLESIRTAIDEWEDAGRPPDYLLGGSRLAEIDDARRNGMLVMSAREHSYIAVSLDHQRVGEAAEASRAAAERRLTRRARTRLLALGAVVALLVGTLAHSLLRSGGDGPGDVMLLTNDLGEIGMQFDAGFNRGVGEFGYRSHKVVVGSEAAPAQIERLLADDPDLVIAPAVGLDLGSLALAHPDTIFVTFDRVVEAPNMATFLFDAYEASYLAGAAAALSTSTGTIGFIGGVDEAVIWGFEAGFGAGARSVDPEVRVLTTYLAAPPDLGDGYQNPSAGEQAGRQLYVRGADVVFAAAGTSGLGVFQAAVDISESTGVHRWAIGVDTDQYATVEDLPGSVGAAAWREHILTSVIKRVDRVIFDAIADHSRGVFDPGIQHRGLADNAVDISYSGGYIDDIRPQIESLRRSIIRGAVDVPCLPTDHPWPSTPETSLWCNS